MDLGCLVIQLNGISEGDLSLRDAYDRATCGSTMKREARAHHTQRPMERARQRWQLAEFNKNLECSVATCIRYSLADFDVLARNFQRP